MCLAQTNKLNSGGRAQVFYITEPRQNKTTNWFNENDMQPERGIRVCSSSDVDPTFEFVYMCIFARVSVCINVGKLEETRLQGTDVQKTTALKMKVEGGNMRREGVYGSQSGKWNGPNKIS